MHILIAHRGNVNGPNPLLENTPEYIDAALKKHYLCEVDVWKINNKLYLSHDVPIIDAKITINVPKVVGGEVKPSLEIHQ